MIDVDQIKAAMDAAVEIVKVAAPQVAQTARVYYDAFRKEGFSEAQALDLTVAAVRTQKFE